MSYNHRFSPAYQNRLVMVVSRVFRFEVYTVRAKLYCIAERRVRAAYNQSALFRCWHVDGAVVLNE